MDESADIVKLYCSRLERELGINLQRNPVTVDLRGSVLAVNGELDDIAAKRQAILLAEEMFGAGCYEDHLTVSPAQAREDGAIRAALVDALSTESVFRRFGLNSWAKEEMHVIRDVPQPEGHLDVIVEDGVASLGGEVWSISHRRMAELLAWWIPGVRGVNNRIVVRPPEADTDDDITDVVRMALEKDPLIHSEQIRVTTHEGVVKLEGYVRWAEERRMAETDAFYVGVAKVDNRIEVAGGK